MKVAIISKPNNGCCFYRCVLPSDYIPWRENGDIFKLFIPDGFKTNIEPGITGFTSEIESFEPDIIFYNRDVPLRNIEWIRKQKKKGIKIVVDIDDYWELSSTHPVYQMWYQEKMNELVIENLREADVVFATTEILRKKVLEYNKNCIVILNAIPFGEVFYKQNGYKGEIESRKMNFLYAGGSTHYHDINLLKNTFNKLGQEKYIQEKAIFSLAGYNPLPNKHCEWDKMVSIFKRTNSYRILNTLPLQQHMTFYDSADVCLVPLKQSEFNQYKSELKIIEAATRELPCIVSDVLPYSELKGFKGLLWNDWQKNIKFCLKNPKEVVSLGKQLAEQVKEKYDIRTWSLMRYEIFKYLITK